MRRRQVAGRLAARIGASPMRRRKRDVGLGQHVQPLLRRDTREVADAKRVVVGGRAPLVPLHVDAERHDRRCALGGMRRSPP